MEKDSRINLLARVARSVTDPHQPESLPPFRALAAVQHGVSPSDPPPGALDSSAIELFESIVEAAYLVALADGVFDALERNMFERVMFAACGRDVPAQQVADLVGDLEGRLAREGLDRRVQALAAKVTAREHAREVLRMGALLAQASEDVSAVERDVMTRIAVALGLDPAEVDAAVDDVRSAIASEGWEMLLESI